MCVCVRGEANAFVGGGERVCEEKRTRSYSEANAFARGDERGCTRTQTRVRYTLHLNGTVYGALESSSAEKLIPAGNSTYVRMYIFQLGKHKAGTLES